MGILHTGRVYSDDLTEGGLIYHYPVTSRGSRDSNEIESMKACGDLGLPIFVITKPARYATTRKVDLGWVQEYDDQAGILLIQFADSDLPPLQSRSEDYDALPFVLTGRRVSKRGLAKIRPNQWRFRFDVLKRYGAQCAVCDIRHPDLLHAAHICPVEAFGSDDPRNGLVFCLNHHRAFDKALFRIHPISLDLHSANSIGDLQELGIRRISISHLLRLPHQEALTWAWSQQAD